MELQEYLGNDLLHDIKVKAMENSKVFMGQNGETKLALANKLKMENEVLKEGVGHLINVIDTAGADIDLLEKRDKYYKDKYGEINEEYVKSGNLVVTRTTERQHAKKLLNRYVKQYESEKKGNENKNKDSKTKLPSK